MKRYQTYKDSGIEWIGEVPEGWEVKRLKYITRINPSKENSKLLKDSDELAVFLPMEKVNEDGTFTTDLRRPINELWSGFTYFEERDTIVAKITPCFENGKGAYLINLGSSVGFGSTEFHVLREITNASISKYLYYITRFDPFRKMGESLMIGVAGQKRVPSTFIENFLIGTPPVLEQQLIATYLDRKTTQIDNLISKKQKLIELLKEERSAIINQAVTKGLNPDAPMKDSGIEWIGEVPEHWEVLRLKWVCNFLYGESLSAQEREGGTIPVYGSNGIIGYHDRAITEKPCIIVGRKGSFGKVSFSVEKCFPIDTTYYIDCNSTNTYLPWLTYLLPLLKMDEFSRDSAVPGLNREVAYGNFVPLPSLSEQKQITTDLDEKTSKVDQTTSKIEKQIELLKEFRTALISEVVTGKIDVRDGGSNG